MRLARVVAAGMAVVLLVSCSDWGASDESEAPTTTRTVVRGGGKGDPLAGPCALSSVDEVRTNFGGPVRLSSDRERCQYEVRDGYVRFAIWNGEGTVNTLAPKGRTIEGLGSAALWEAAGEGGRLAVQVGDEILLFEGELPLKPAQVEARMVGWARGVVERFEEFGVETPVTTPDDEDPEVCRLVARSEIAAVTKVPVGDLKPDAQGDVCVYTLGSKGSLTLGPVTTPAPADGLASISRSAVVDGKPQPWPETEVDVADGGLLLVNPAAPGFAELYVLDDGDLVHYAASARTTEQAKDLVVGVAGRAS